MLVVESIKKYFAGHKFVQKDRDEKKNIICVLNLSTGICIHVHRTTNIMTQTKIAIKFLN